MWSIDRAMFCSEEVRLPRESCVSHARREGSDRHFSPNLRQPPRHFPRGVYTRVDETLYGVDVCWNRDQQIINPCNDTVVVRQPLCKPLDVFPDPFFVCVEEVCPIPARRRENEVMTSSRQPSVRRGEDEGHELNKRELARSWPYGTYLFIRIPVSLST